MIKNHNKVLPQEEQVQHSDLSKSKLTGPTRSNYTRVQEYKVGAQNHNTVSLKAPHATYSTI